MVARAPNRSIVVLVRGLFAAGLLLLAGCPEPKSVTCPSGRVCPSPYTCAADQDICILGNCGNGVKEAAEACDDGNKINNDGCNRDCTSDNSCGNGIVDRFDPAESTRENEVCDDGPLNGQPGHCSVDCKSSGLCGNGIRDNGEDCDYCIAEDASIDSRPGDAATDGPAGGDAGPDADSDASDADADSDADSDAATAHMTCALGIRESRVCNDNCTTARCGDRKINRAAGELCDDGGESTTCNVDCTLAGCGDGKVNRTAGEECDLSGGADSTNCNGAVAGLVGVACLFSRCGDGYVNRAAGEECDVLGGADTVNCNGSQAPAGVACHHSVCGDGYTNAAALETCDVLGGADTVDCNGKGAGAASCRVATCSDGYVNRAAGETCEVLADGNDTATCNGVMAMALRCRAATCGDGYVNHAATETCEVTASGADTATCNGTAAGALKCHDRVCGDGYINAVATEVCDDHNSLGGDGCDASCKIEVGFTCSTPGPSTCKEICGDGRVTGHEVCDDFNTSSCGGCSATCSAVQTASQPTGSITAVASSALNGGESFTLSDGVHAPVTFEFTNGSAAPGHIQILRTNADAATMAGRIVSAINGVGAALAINATAPSPPVVQLASSIFGAGGNVTIGKTVRAAGFVTTGMANGVAYDCAAGAGCGVDSDCASGVCCPTSGVRGGAACAKNTCLGSSCNDGVRNGSETSADCGGVACAPCGDTKGCVIASDCLSGVCTGGTCQAASCTDGVQNGSEADTDCGTACAGQPCTGGGSCKCPDLSTCVTGADCASGVCTGGTCQASSCTDGVRNGGEAAIDCGGSCLLCAGSPCTADSECKSHDCPSVDAGADADPDASGGGSPRTCN